MFVSQPKSLRDNEPKRNYV